MKNILFAVILSAILIPVLSVAQIGNDFTFSNELGVEIIPTYPRPNEKVFVKLSLYSGDLDSADIVWQKNGQVVLEGKGETRYSFTTGSIGVETKIEIGISLLNGASFSKSFVLTPAGVDVVWEANSYVPPFYKGKALHSYQGSLKITAVPEFMKNSKRISPENLIYKWSNGVNNYQNQSGYGKSSITVSGSLLGRTEEIKVLVTDPVNNLVAQGSANITPSDPEIVFYENNPYYGHLFDSAISGSFDLKDSEVQILAVPYFFTQTTTGSLNYKWMLNNQSIPDLIGSRTSIFRKPEGESGKSVVHLEIENTNRILQQASKSLEITFEE